MTKRKIGVLGTMLALGAATLFPGSASAMTVTVDGIKQAGEYTGGTAHGEKSLLWYNQHESIYTEAAGNMNPLVWEINQVAAGNFSLNVFFEVPLYARRMIWKDGCTYKTGNAVSAACMDLAPGGDTAYLDAYDEGSHHSDVNMDYKTQTESEYFKLENSGGGTIFFKKWQDEDTGTPDNPTWATSREYLISNMICSETKCTEFDRTSSIEVMWQGLGSQQDATDLLNSIAKMELHLSDEARGLPPVGEVPVPAAIWLFGTALIGFIGMARRTNLS